MSDKGLALLETMPNMEELHVDRIVNFNGFGLCILKNLNAFTCNICPNLTRSYNEHLLHRADKMRQLKLLNCINVDRMDLFRSAKVATKKRKSGIIMKMIVKFHFDSCVDTTKLNGFSPLVHLNMDDSELVFELRN